MEGAEAQREGSEQLPTVLVAKREVPVQDESLQMKCDAKEIPDPLQSAASWAGKDGARRELSFKDVVNAKSNQTRWIALGMFAGQGRVAGTDSIQEVSIEGGQPVAMVVVETEQRLLGILGPKDPGAPAIWWAWPLAALSVASEGAQGLLRKSPQMVSLSAYGSRVELAEVCSVRNDKSSFTSGAEARFMKALGRA